MVALTSISIAYSMPDDLMSSEVIFVSVEGPEPAIDVAARGPVEIAADERQDRIAEPPMEPRHRSRPDASLEAIAVDEVEALSSVGSTKRLELAEVVAAVGVAHHDPSSARSADPPASALP